MIRLRITVFITLLALTGCSMFPGGNGNTNVRPVNTPQEQKTTEPVPPTPKPIAGQNNILFIVDASGSMKAKAGGTTKMDAAKEVVVGLIGQLPPTTNAGLMAYGHR